MFLFRWLKQCSKRRTAWFLMMLTAIGLLTTSLYFQYGMALAPCVLCIYQRCAIFGILGASLIGLFASNNSFLRFLAIIIWLYSATKGLFYAMDQVSIQFKPSLTNVCELFPQFPSWLPLDQWIPTVFTAHGECSAKIWQYLSLEMSEWMVLIFSSYLFIGVCVFIAQFAKRKRSWWY